MISDIEYVIESSRKKIFDWKEIWQYRELFFFFTWRDIKVKYKQTSIGILWVVLQPVFTVLVFSLFFGHALNAPSSGLPYPVFVFSGLLFWNVFSSSVNNASSSMITNAPIIKKIYFPRIIIPVSCMLVAFVDFGIALVLFILMIIYYQIDISAVGILTYWPAGILLLIIATTGISCLLAALTVKYKDFRFVIPFGLQLTLFISPIIYPLSIIKSEWISYLLAVNPIYSSVMLFRAPLLGSVTNWNLIMESAFFAVLFLAVGIYYFKKTEDYFADIA